MGDVSTAGAGPDFRWPAGYDPAQAALYIRNTRRIGAAPEAIWAQLVAAPLWPQWYRFSKNVSLRDGGTELRAGSRFTWTTQGIRLETEVREFEPFRRLAWFATSPFVSAYHAWDLRPDGDTTVVVTDETQRGIMPALGSAIVRPMMLRAHDAWLAGLERRTTHRNTEPADR